MRKELGAALGLSVVMTFTLNALVLAGPVTPIRFDVGPVAQLLNPHFSQNWQLFAPDPVSDERGVVARLRCDGDPEAWVDISSPAIAETQGTRLFPSRESRIVSSALVERFVRDDIAQRLSERNAEDLIPDDGAAGKRAERLLARYAARVTACSGQSPLRPTAVQIRYVTRSLPPWSTRMDLSTRGEVHVLDSKWIVL